MKHYITIMLTVFVLLSTTATIAHGTEMSAIEHAMAGKHRANTSARDQYRHPMETLNFFQVQENHTVVEIWPGGGGWYTEVLAPLMREKGVLYAAQYSPETTSEYQQRNLKKFNDKLAANPEVYDKVKLAVFNPPEDFKLGAPGSVDRVVTFRNLHNWMRYKDEGVLAIFKAFHKVLKPGGKLGVIDHRLPEDRDSSKASHSGYVKQSYAIKMAEAAGFTLEASSEINANAKDKADHPKGVWTLPPVLALKEKDKQKYLDIGESDRMTLLFVKN